MSRLCKINEEPSFDRESEHHVFTIIEKSSPKAMNISQIVTDSQQDQQVKEAVSKINENSWNSLDKNIFFPFREELTTMGPVLLRGTKLVIPETLRSDVLKLAHEGHPGETVMKRRLRAKVWWPLIDRHVEKFVKSCRDCLLVTLPDKPPPMKRHRFPDGPWQCIAIDLMGPLPNQEQLLVIIDYYSRYQETKFLKTTTSAVIIDQLLEVFARLGIPKSIRADNGPQFASREFKEFCSQNNIELVQTPPYWPQANGEVENMNRSILKRLQICHANNLNYRSELQKFTLMYNVTPHGTTGKSPSELLLNRNIRDKIPSITDLIHEPCDEEARDNDIINKQKGKEKEDKIRNAKDTDIKQGDKVLIRNMNIPHKLTTRFNMDEYTVTQKVGNEVTVSGGDGQVYKRHISHVKKIPELPSDQKACSTNTTLDIVSEKSATPNPHGTPPPSAADQDKSDQEDPVDLSAPKRLPPLKLKKMEG
ncbi:uncharacterized protein K02A2.6-like, partial [Anoplophora glabripennis]|uniref:uncharacterized protein K02A2.6-like n=1 Tax=Anoplophora glabripennis TaxID=217634 RepID=UPI0008735F4A